MSENHEKRIRSLERSVRGLTIAFILSIGVSVFAFYQITSITSKIPSYRELKEDVQSIKKVVDSSAEYVPVVKEKVTDGYHYTKEKVSDGYNYTKEKTNDVIDYFKGEDDEKKSLKEKPKK